MSRRAAGPRKAGPALLPLLLAAICALGGAFRTSLARAEEPLYPAARGLVNDFADVLSSADRDSLERLLTQLQRESGIQFAVATLTSTQPATPAEYKVELFRRWGIGRAGKDDGLLMLVAVNERQVWFETGYGLEGVLTDAMQARIVRHRIVPSFRQGDYGAGIRAGVNVVIATLRAAGLTTLPQGEAEPRRRRALSDLPVALILFFILMVVLSQRASRWRNHRGYRRHLGRWGGPFGGGFGGGFGGFGGGWGGGGGGGFGGFGGGRSGGGGGGGGW